MKRLLLCSAAAGCLCLAATANVDAADSDQAALEAQVDAAIQPTDLRNWMTLPASEPNQVGSPHDKANAEWILAQFVCSRRRGKVISIVTTKLGSVLTSGSLAVKGRFVLAEWLIYAKPVELVCGRHESDSSSRETSRLFWKAIQDI